MQTVSDSARTLATALGLDSETGWSTLMERATMVVRNLRRQLDETPGAKWTVRASALGFDVHQALGLDDEDGNLLRGIERLQTRVTELEAAQIPRPMSEAPRKAGAGVLIRFKQIGWHVCYWDAEKDGWRYDLDERQIVRYEALEWFPCPPDPEGK